MVALVALSAGFFPLGAQAQGATARARADLEESIKTLDSQTLAELQKATDEFDAALLRGDADAAILFLATDFRLGNSQYRKRDAAYMKRALPGQLAHARFGELKVTLSSVEVRGDQILARGRIEARTQENNGEKRGGISGDYAAFWSETPQGWRLSRDDATFNCLTQAALPFQIAPVTTTFPDQKSVLGLPRINPSVVLEQANQSPVESLAFSPDGQTLATYGSQEGVRFSSAQSGVLQKSMEVPMFVNSMCYAPNGTLLTGHNDGKVRHWNTTNGELLHEFDVSQWSVYGVRVSPDGQTLAVDGAGKVQLWDLKSGRKTREFGEQNGNIRSLEFSPDAKTLAFTSSAGIELWDVSKERRLALLQGEDWSGFSPQGKPVTSSFKLRFHNAENGAVEREIAVPNPLRRPIATLGGIPFTNGFIYVPRAQLSPDGKWAASIYADGSIGIWDVETGALKQQLRGFFREDTNGGDVSQIAFSPDGSSLAVGSRNGEVAIWSLAKN